MTPVGVTRGDSPSSFLPHLKENPLSRTTGRVSRLSLLVALATTTVVMTAVAGNAVDRRGPVPNGHAHAGTTGGGGPMLAAAPGGYPIGGIDVSNHQGTIDWSRVAAAGARFAYAKATEGVYYTDPYFNANLHGAKDHGIYAGAYHFARPDTSSGRAQADYFLDRAQYINDGRTLAPMLDIEWPWNGSGSPYPCYGLSTGQMGSWIRDFVNRVRERTGRRTMIYTNVNWWTPCTGNDASFGENPLFIARYAASPGTLPAGWSTWTLWQYADAGSLPGDQDVFNGSEAGLAALARGGSGASLSGDGRDDLVSVDPNGELRAFANIDGLNFSWGAARVVGNGWLDPARVRFADLNGDGRDDLVSVDPNGELRAFANIDGLNFGWGAARVVGNGWLDPARVRFADLNGDGRDDLVSVDPNGELRAFANIDGLNFSWDTPRVVGNGWTNPAATLFA